MRPPQLKGKADSTQLINPFALNQAMLIGLSAEIPGLAKSVSRIQKAIQEPHGIFPEFETQVMVDLAKSGNRTVLVHRLNALAEGSRVQPFDNLMLYFVGHADKKPRFRIFMPERIFSQEMPIEDRDWLGWETLCEWLAPVRTKNLLLVLDCVHANQLNHRDTLRWLQDLDNQQPGQKMILAANCSDPSSWEREWTCFFTEAFAEGLEGWSARNDKGLVDTDSLFRYLTKRIPQIAQEKTNKPEIQPSPFRLFWPERPKPLMTLTQPKERTGLDDDLEAAILEGRCLLWVGDHLKNRSTPQEFPPRQSWEGVQRDVWLEYVDSQRAPGIASMQLAKLGLSVLDIGIDSSVSKACLKKDHRQWVPLPNTNPPAKDKPILIRLCGDLNAPDFAYEWEDLDKRFEYLLEWLQLTRRWDTLLLFGFPLEELPARNWLRIMTQVARRVCMVFPHHDEHDRVPWLKKIGVELLYAQDGEILKLLKKVAQAGVKQEQTQLVRIAFPRKKEQKGRDVASTPNPFRGLLPFRELHYDIFYGRLRPDGTGGDLKDLHDDVLNHPKVLFYGPAGCGKTSLLQAGLFPVLEKVDGFRIFQSDADNPLEDLAQKAAGEPCFREPPDAQNVLERLGFLSHQTGRPVLICIDHMERALAQKAGGPAQHRTPGFLEYLEEAIRKLEQSWPTGQWRLLFCLRKDAYVEMTDFIKRQSHDRARAIHHRELSMLRESAAREAICAPIPEPFHIEAELVDRLLVDLRQWHPGQTPTYEPMWLQIVCRELFEKAREAAKKSKENTAILSLSHYKTREGGLRKWLHTWVHDKTLGKLSTRPRRAARDILSLLVNDQNTRRHRSWGELSSLLSPAHEADHLNAAKEHLLNSQVIRERKITQGPPQLELTHDLLVDIVSEFRDTDLELASQVMGAMEVLEGRPLSRSALGKMQKHASYVDRIPAERRKDIQGLYDASQGHYRKRTLLQSGAVVLLVVLLGLGWLYAPRSTDSTVDQRIDEMLSDQSADQRRFWASVEYLKSDHAIGLARKKLSVRLLRREGQSACKLLKALFTITRGRVGESIRIATEGKKDLAIQRLQCRAGTQFKRIELRGAKLNGASLSSVDLSGANLQEVKLAHAQLQKATLLSANLLRADLQKSLLRGANLEGIKLQYANLNHVDARKARLGSSALLGATLHGALFTSSQVKTLGEAGAPLQGALCLSSRTSKRFPKGRAYACFKWHFDGDPQKAKPSACPEKLKGPILSFASLGREGRCPRSVKKLIVRFSAYCPPGNAKACQMGKECQRSDGKQCFNLGQLYAKGQGVAANPGIAAVLFKQACVASFGRGCSALGEFYYRGDGMKKSLYKAASLFQQGCKQGDATGCAMLGLFYERGLRRKADIVQAREQYSKACDKGSAFACLRLGHIYTRGKGIKKDRSEGAKNYRLACERDEGAGCFWLGHFFVKRRQRRAARPHLSKARRLLIELCKQKQGRACALLGKMSGEGLGARKSKRTSIRYYTLACKLKDGLACNALGSAYDKGRGVRKSKKRAFRFFLQACSAHHGEGCNNLGSFYERGKGVRRNRRKARKYYQKSCDLYYGWGCNDLAELYYSGKGVRRNRRKARKLYKKACSLGVNDACR